MELLPFSTFPSPFQSYQLWSSFNSSIPEALSWWLVSTLGVPKFWQNKIIFSKLFLKRFLFIYLFIYLFIFREVKRGGETEGNINVWVAFCVPPTGDLGTGRVPWLGIQSAALWFVGRHSVHWATPARAQSFDLTFSYLAILAPSPPYTWALSTTWTKNKAPDSWHHLYCLSIGFTNLCAEGEHSKDVLRSPVNLFWYK